MRIPFQEEKHLQLFHFWPAYRAGGRDTVSVLVTREGVLSDSTDILRWADHQAAPERKLFPEDTEARLRTEELEDYLDESLGVAARLWMYTFMLHEIPLLTEYAKKHGVPGYQLKMLPFALPFMRGFIHRLLELTPTSREDSQAEVGRAFDQIAERLADGRKFLMGGRFTAADLTFAALSPRSLSPRSNAARRRPCPGRDFPPPRTTQ